MWRVDVDSRIFWCSLDGPKSGFAKSSALAQGIEEALRKEGKRPLSIEGLPPRELVLMDFGDVVVSVFQTKRAAS